VQADALAGLQTVPACAGGRGQEIGNHPVGTGRSRGGAGEFAFPSCLCYSVTNAPGQAWSGILLQQKAPRGIESLLPGKIAAARKGCSHAADLFSQGAFLL